jgi:hypothetical protein
VPLSVNAVDLGENCQFKIAPKPMQPCVTQARLVWSCAGQLAQCRGYLNIDFRVFLRSRDS